MFFVTSLPIFFRNGPTVDYNLPGVSHPPFCGRLRVPFGLGITQPQVLTTNRLRRVHSGPCQPSAIFQDVVGLIPGLSQAGVRAFKTGARLLVTVVVDREHFLFMVPCCITCMCMPTVHTFINSVFGCVRPVPPLYSHFSYGVRRAASDTPMAMKAVLEASYEAQAWDGQGVPPDGGAYRLKSRSPWGDVYECLMCTKKGAPVEVTQLHITSHGHLLKLWYHIDEQRGEQQQGRPLLGQLQLPPPPPPPAAESSAADLTEVAHSKVPPPPPPPLVPRSPGTPRDVDATVSDLRREIDQLKVRQEVMQAKIEEIPPYYLLAICSYHELVGTHFSGHPRGKARGPQPCSNLCDCLERKLAVHSKYNPAHLCYAAAYDPQGDGRLIK
jgi:hypothetical protein